MAWKGGMDAGAHEGPVPAWETVEDVLKDEVKKVEKTDEESTVINVHRKPLTQGTC